MKTFGQRSVFPVRCLCIVFVLLIAQVAFAQNECNSTGAPTTTAGAIAAGDTGQTSRLFRDGRGSTCTFNRTATTSPGAFLSDQYSFTNTTGGTACVFIDLDALGCGVATNQIGLSAYLTSYNPASILTNLISDSGLSTGMNFSTSMNFSVAAGATYIIVVHNINSGTFCPAYSFKQYITNNCRLPGTDFANDGRADLAVFRPSASNSNWYALDLTTGLASATLGSTGDIPVPGDYVGDEETNPAVFRPSNGTWYTSTDPATNYGAQQWGVSGDVPVQGDYDRDGVTDIAVFRPSNNTWYILRSSTATLLQTTLGVSGDKAVPADYDGDGRMDPAVWRPSNGLWTILSSAGNYGSLANQAVFGLSSDLPVPADYDGDSKADLAVFRPSDGTWYIFRTSLTVGQLQVVPFGMSGDIPQPADYDDDGKADQGLFRTLTNTWHIRRSTAGDTQRLFGLTGDQPVSRANNVQ